MVLVDDGMTLTAEISHRLTGNATAPAISSAKARLPQNRTVLSPASIAPGITSMMSLSTTSMIRMETVSAASASLSTAPKASPALSSGIIVKAYPNKNAKSTASAMSERFPIRALCQSPVRAKGSVPWR